MRPVLVALLLVGFICQHFACCCGASCAVVCDEHSTSQPPAETHVSHCSHGHGAQCGSHTDEHSGQQSYPVEHGSDHDHHFCLGTHVFFMPSSDFNIDFSLQLSGFIIPRDAIDLFGRQLAAGRFAADAGPPDTSSPRKLRAQLSVYCV